MPEEGQQAPGFTLEGVDGDGNTVRLRLSDLRGRWVVLYFYPKDDTPGCTTQACGIRDEWAAFRDRDAVVLGVSPDDVESHRRFSEKHGLPFTLLADPDHTTAESYGVWKQKTLFGRMIMGVERSTFVIDPEGRIARAFRRVRPAEHVEKVVPVLPARA